MSLFALRKSQQAHFYAIKMGNGRMAQQLQKLYTRTIGIFFVMVVVTLIADYSKFGHGPETWHKIFHVLLGSAVLYYGWNTQGFWKPFSLANGAFFTYVALFGFTFPDFGGLDAFNKLDTFLHSVVGVSGLIVGSLGRFNL